MPTLLIKILRLGEVNKQVHVMLTVKVSGLKLPDSKTRALSTGAHCLALEPYPCEPLGRHGVGQDFLLGLGGAETWSVGATVCAVPFSPLVPQVAQLPHSPQPSRFLGASRAAASMG